MLTGTLNVELFGPWDKVNSLLSTLSSDVRKFAISGQRKAAEKVERRVKSHLQNQDIPGWTPLNENYKERKANQGYSEDILVRTHEYYNAIESWRENNQYHVGVREGRKYANGNSIAAVGALHEWYSVVPGKPYRPLWTYTFNELQGGPGLRDIVKDVMVKKLREKGYPIEDINKSLNAIISTF